MLPADLGADVVKTERPGTADDTRARRPPAGQEGTPARFLSANRDRRSAAPGQHTAGTLPGPPAADPDPTPATRPQEPR